MTDQLDFLGFECIGLMDGVPVAEKLKDETIDMQFFEEDRQLTKLTHDDTFWASCDAFKKKAEKCKICHKNFFQIRKHMLVHTKEKPYKCTECVYEATQKSNLNRHIKSKHRDAVVKCSKCSKSFKRNDKLKSHMKTHSRED